MKDEFRIPCIRLELEEDGTMRFTDGVNFWQKRSIEVCFGNISNRESQWQLTKKNLHTDVLIDYSYRLPPKRGLQLAPLPRLEEVDVGLLGEEVIPVGEGDEGHKFGLKVGKLKRLNPSTNSEHAFKPENVSTQMMDVISAFGVSRMEEPGMSSSRRAMMASVSAEWLRRERCSMA